jgi:HNH endonuclease
VTDATCSIPDCGRPVNSSTYCKRHYYRWHRYGDPLGSAPARKPVPPRPPVPCSVDGCDRSRYGRGLCEPHYARQRRHGGLHDKRAERRDLLERFTEKVDTNGPLSPHRPDLGPCHIWSGPPNSSGYGSFNIGSRRVVGAHVAAVLLSGDDVPTGYEPDHLCRVRLCVRREHLEVVTAAENKRRIVYNRRGSTPVK